MKTKTVKVNRRKRCYFGQVNIQYFIKANNGKFHKMNILDDFKNI